MSGFAGDSIKLVHRGTINGTQSWSVSQWVSVLPTPWAPSPAELAIVATAADVAFQTFWATLLASNAVAVTYDKCDAYYYPASQTRPWVTATCTSRAAVPGTGASSLLPPQVCMVATLHTASAGRSGRGRLYLPFTTGPLVAGTLNAVTATTQGIATAFAVYVRALRSYVSVPARVTSLTPIVASFTAGAVAPVTSILCNSKLDTQRPRTHKMPITTAYAQSIP